MLSRPSTPTDAAPIVMEQVLATVNGDMQLFKKLAHLVRDQIAADLPVIRTDVATQNPVALAASSHRLKGSLGAISAVPACQACSELNQMARAGAVESFAQGLTRMEKEIDRLQWWLQSWLAGYELKGLEHAKNPLHQ